MNPEKIGRKMASHHLAVVLLWCCSSIFTFSNANQGKGPEEWGVFWVLGCTACSHILLSYTCSSSCIAHCRYINQLCLGFTSPPSELYRKTSPHVRSLWWLLRVGSLCEPRRNDQTHTDQYLSKHLYLHGRIQCRFTTLYDCIFLVTYATQRNFHIVVSCCFQLKFPLAISPKILRWLKSGI